MLTSAQANVLLDQVVSSVAYDTIFDGPWALPVLYGIRTSDKAFERGGTYGSLGQWQKKVPGQKPAEDKPNEGFTKDFVHDAFALEVPIERELVDDQKWGLLEEVGAQLGTTGQYTMETQAAAPFNDAFSGATYTSPDALPLASAAHVNKQGTNSQANYSGAAMALSLANLDTARQAMRAFTNSRGLRMLVKPRLLLTGPDKEQAAWELIRSGNRPDTMNNVANFYNGALDLMVWDWLTTNAGAWFLVDPMLMKRMLLWYQRIGIEFYGKGDYSTGDKTVGGYVRYSNGFTGWEWVYCAKP